MDEKGEIRRRIYLYDPIKHPKITL